MAVKKSIAGITLIEMLLAISIFSVISVAIYSVFRSGIKIYRVTQKNLKLQENLDKIVNTVVSDLQQCRQMLKLAPSEVSFWDSKGQKITYTLADNIIYRNGIAVLEEGCLKADIKFVYFSQGNPVDNYGENLNKKQRDGITLIEFIISITDGSQSLEISSAVNIRLSD